MKYRIVYYPWDSMLPYKLEKLDEHGWEYCAQSFIDLAQADRYIAGLKSGEQVVREFEL